MKKQLLPAGMILGMLITTVTGCSLPQDGQIGSMSENNTVLIQHYSKTTLHQSEKTNTDALNYEVPIYLIPIPENTQREIWKLSQENHLAYELVLAILQIDAHYNTRMDEVKAVIEELASYRNYWREQDYPDEMVFDLLILSAQRGIEGSKGFIARNNAYDQDDYVQRVTAYKYYLDQNQHTDDGVITKV